VKALNSFPEDVMAQAKHIKLLALDVDGVLTDGSIYIDSNGNESKKFYVHDGYGIVSIREKFGIETVVISGRQADHQGLWYTDWRNSISLDFG